MCLADRRATNGFASVSIGKKLVESSASPNSPERAPAREANGAGAGICNTRTLSHGETHHLCICVVSMSRGMQ